MILKCIGIGCSKFLTGDGLVSYSVMSKNDVCLKLGGVSAVQCKMKNEG